MNRSEKIAVSLPDGLAERARRAIRQGRATSVSTYVASALAEKIKLYDLSALLEEMLAETGGPLTARERRAADRALGVQAPSSRPRGRAASKPEWAGMPGLTLDAGALIAFERNDRRIVALLLRNLQHGHRLAVPAGVVGQVWRDGRRQARLARLLGAAPTEVIPLDDRRAREAGQLCRVRGTADVIDGRSCCAHAHAATASSRQIPATSGGVIRPFH
jgi:hypothetical protein